MQTFIGTEEARTLILDAVSPMRSEAVNLTDALGRTLAEPLRSRDDIPPFDNSAMDGFAVRVADLKSLPAVLAVIEDIPAGAFPSKAVQPGTCARIMTGAPFPQGADAVVPVEWTEPVDGGDVRFLRAPSDGQFVRHAGRDVQKGTVVVGAGAVVTPPVVGMAATLGYAAVEVSVRPRVAVVATGDELVPPGADLQPGQIRDSNGPALAAQAHAAGAEVWPTFHAPDDEAVLRATIERALAADVLIFSGGVSVGDYDLVKQVLDDLGMELLFWKVRQRPGKPLAFGLLDGKPIFGLPGNPVSSAMCFEQYVRPALAKMLGRQEVHRPRHPATLAEATAKVPGLHFFTRGFARFNKQGLLEVRDTGPQGSNLYSSVVKANCIIHLPEAWEEAPAGSAVEIEWLRW